MDWLERLNVGEASIEFGAAGAAADVLGWMHMRELPDNAPHLHTHFEVCQVGGHGAGLFRLADQDHTLSPGVLFVARPGVVHQIVNTARPWMELYWVSYQLRPVPGQAVSGALRSFLASPVSVVPDEAGQVAAAWRSLRSLAPAAGPDSLRHLVAAFLLSVAEAFAEPAAPAVSARGGAPPAVRQALRYIHDNLERPITADEVARQAGVSRRHLSRMLHEHGGMPFHAYVRSARLHLAAHLLRRSDLPVKSVGARVGYPDVHHFTHVFSRHIGCPPAAYRQRPQGSGSGLIDKGAT